MSPIDTSKYYNIVAKHSGKCIAVKGARLDAGVEVIQDGVTQENHQSWKFVSLGGNYYRIISKISDKCLGVKDEALKSGQRIVQWENLDLDTQKWKLEDANDGYYWITSKHTGMSIYNGLFSSEWEVHQHDTRGKRDCWKPIHVGDDFYKIIGYDRGGWGLTVSDGSMRNGDKISIWEYQEGTNQKWNIISLEGGFYRIEAKHSGKCLTVFEGALKTSDSFFDDLLYVFQLNCINDNHQIWRVIPVDGNCFKIVSAFNDKCLDVQGGLTWETANIILCEYTGEDNQKWSLVPTVENPRRF